MTKTGLLSIAPVRRIVAIAQRVWSIRFIRFLFVGGLNTAVGYLLFAIFILLRFHYAVATLLGTVLGILFNFNTTGRIVFHNKNPKLIARFFLIYGMTYIVNVFFLQFFDHIHMDMLLAGAS